MTSDSPHPVRRRLPIGVQTFREIREEQYYYVDKTAFAHQLISQGKYYFLSRPRRFGKSLLIDTLAELFEGNEPLFRGLYCHDRWNWSVRYPVIRISFAEGRLESRADLEEHIHHQLNDNADQLGVVIDPQLSGQHLRFKQLIQQIETQSGQRVVVLVDEYDKPLLDNLTNTDVAKAMREGLRNLYSVIKGQDANIQFAMLTGVSKFSKVSIFSGLNHLNDVTLDQAYSALCGYTETDLDTVFAAELDGLDRDKIREWYNGYNWTGEAVYNPFDILLLFQKRQFKPYWFETGTPTFMLDVLTREQIFTPQLARQYSDFELLSAFDIERIEPVALLFQTGYATIQSTEELMPGQTLYILGYPNKEVEISLNSALLPALGLNAQRSLVQRIELFKYLREPDLRALEQHIVSLFASIPHDWYRNNAMANYEGYYASVFYSHFAALGVDIRVEDATNTGQIDMVVCVSERVLIFEFKVVELSPEGRALEQIKAKRYAEKYQSRNEPIVLIGVEFSKERRSVVGFDVECVE